LLATFAFAAAFGATSCRKGTGASPALTAASLASAPLTGEALAGMVKIPAGSFMMGCSPGDAECLDREKPSHVVRLKAFWLDATPVTQAQYRAAVGAELSHFGGRPTCPVESVTWAEARDCCAKLGKRLPTEAEWEYAARAGATGARYGDLGAIAWTADDSGEQTHPVREKAPNVFGLYDMLGNVWQWCADWYDENYYARSPAENPGGPASGAGRVLRGGSWNLEPWDVRVSSRIGTPPGYRVITYGFRCARDAE
jgi:formylglycine-generating enzyme required for sulfatase activity